MTLPVSESETSQSWEWITARYRKYLAAGYRPASLAIFVGRILYMRADGTPDPDDIRNVWYFKQEEEGGD